MKRSGFTVIELMAVVAVGAVLAAMLLPVLGGARGAAVRTREVACGKALMAGVVNYASEHDGQMIAGYKSDVTYGPDGRQLAYPASARYPWRLLPYIGGGTRDVMWANPSGSHESIADAASESYAVSVSPTFGMNVFYVGGDDTGNSGQGIKPTAKNFAAFGKFAITTYGEAASPAGQILFASARMKGEGGAVIPGYHMVQAPHVAGRIWTDAAFSAGQDPARHGYVDFRYDGKAVAVHLDGHVELLGERELRDMRRWSNLARIADDPDHHL
jgi:prepilin-type N-terminal cleavage/methylation domain-containing protein